MMRNERLPSVSVGDGSAMPRVAVRDDLADACVFVMQHYSEEPVNIGTGEDMTIRDFARLVADIVGYKGRIAFDKSKPDGTPRKVLDVSRLAELGWHSRTPIGKRLERTYQAFLEAEERNRSAACRDGRVIRSLRRLATRIRLPAGGTSKDGVLSGDLWLMHPCVKAH
jgi:nucleoside-diphosphate-sugar epimerase